MTDVDTLNLADRMFTAIERGDLVALQHCYAPGIVVWANFDGKELDLAAERVLKRFPEVVTTLGMTGRASGGLPSKMRYSEISPPSTSPNHILCPNSVSLGLLLPRRMT